MKTILCGAMTTVLAALIGTAVAQGAGTKHEGASSKQAAAAAKIKSGAPDITLADLKQAIADKAVVLLDCNGSKSYASGHIPGAIDFEGVKAEIAKSLPMDKSTLVVAYCGGPKCRAYKSGAEAATKLGYTNVKHFSGGISGWKAAGEKAESKGACLKCSPVEGAVTSGKPAAVTCKKCGLAAGSPGCCKLPQAK